MGILPTLGLVSKEQRAPVKQF